MKRKGSKVMKYREQGEGMCIHTKPQSEAEEIVLIRARMLTDFKWTPMKDLPAYTIKEGHCIIPAGKEVSGFPYSSTEETDKFIAENVSFETFLSVIPNPDSKLYQVGHGKVGRSNYGMVCNGFVRYVFGIPYRVNTQCWHTLEGMRMVQPKETYTVQDMKLCDVLHAFNDGRNHVALVTDIIKDNNGTVVGVEISESVAPFCKRETYTPEEYYEKYRPFALWRYDLINNVPPLNQKEIEILKSGREKIPPKIAVDNGDKSNYFAGEEIIISVFTEEADVVEILQGEKVVQEFKTNGRAFFPYTLPIGYYKAQLRNAKESVEFCVTDPEIWHDVQDDCITIHVKTKDSQSKLLYMDFRLRGDRAAGIAKYEVLTDEEIESGTIVRRIPKGAENYKIYFRNPYGVWSHRMIKI